MVAIFGGSFSPVHIGHVNVARAIVDNALADEVWMLPCRRNPLKEAGKVMMEDDVRLGLLNQAAEYANAKYFGTEQKIKIDSIELSLPQPSYTCVTMRELERRYPGMRFRIVMGGDSYLGFDRWKDAEWLEREFAPIVYPRPGFKLEKLKEGWTILENVPEFSASSSEIRAGRGLPEWQPWINGGVIGNQ